MTWQAGSRGDRTAPSAHPSRTPDRAPRRRDRSGGRTMTARIDWHWPASFTGHECHRERDMLVNRHTNVAAVLGPTGVLFGASILGRSGPHTWLARRVLTIINWRGAFGRQPRRLRGGAPPDPRGVIRPGGARDHGVGRDLRGLESAVEEAVGLACSLTGPPRAGDHRQCLGGLDREAVMTLETKTC